MPDEVLRQAFEPFFTTKEVGEGSGLGLSMVYGFARQSGGMVRIESELDRGTTVRVMLPVADERAQPSDSPSPILQERIHALNVLLVEDDRDVRESTVMLLQSMGGGGGGGGMHRYGSRTCRTGSRSASRACRNRPVDQRYRVAGGSKRDRTCGRRLKLRPDLNVILVSGYPEGSLEKSGLTKTRFLLLGKPYTITELSEALARAMTDGKSLVPNARETQTTD